MLTINEMRRIFGMGIMVSAPTRFIKLRTVNCDNKCDNKNEIREALELKGVVFDDDKIIGTPEDLPKFFHGVDTLESYLEKIDFELKYCGTCNQMTNHLNNVCQKCK